ncbi:MAG TPA: thiamine phosphate synthase, partial [Candidatus Saccharimonadia bacterium]|nr:thiamine phosphate synthase [Candidatus Saccharimonadia bacterium]
MDELSLCLVTDRAQTRGRDLVTVVTECLAAGLPAVQVREKDLGAAELAALCRAIRQVTREHGASLIVNDRVDVALTVGADAVQRTHLSLPVDDIR